MAENLRIGIVGCGWISDWHGRAATSIEDVALVACCDTVPAAAEAFKERHGCERAYTDHREMLREHELDAVILATWPTDHLEQIRDCLDLGVTNVLCEKSITVHDDEVLGVWQAARDAGALVVEGFMYRHHPAMRKVDELVSSGALGNIDRVTAGFDNFDAEEFAADDPARGWRRTRELHGGVPYDHLCYCVNASNHLAGALPAQVMALSWRSERYGVVNRVYGLIEYENGTVGMVESSKRSNFNYEVKVFGSTGQLTLPVSITPDRVPPRERVEPGESTALYLSRKVDLFAYETETIRIPAADPYLLELRDFVAAVRGTSAPEPSLAESVLNVHTINALLRSGEERVPAPVELPDAVRSELDEAAQRV
ncbi:MAG: D-xylose 1-dehydrogenase D-xylono,5-lactone-forming [Solirubrobacteraceae bacterium]|nr:D-xylose 1-dehydrogenase D-xylono,5-lactone-forming [Solirubrobacteraceae bacterium]